MVHDLRVLLRLSKGRAPKPTAAILDSRTLRSTPESRARGGYYGAKRKKGSKVHAAVDTLGHLLALFVSPASEHERAWVGELVGAVQEATGESVELVYYVDQGYTGDRPASEAEARGISLEVVKHPAEAKRASCSCHAAGSWNAVSHGHRDFGAWSKTTRGYLLL